MFKTPQYCRAEDKTKVIVSYKFCPHIKRECVEDECIYSYKNGVNERAARHIYSCRLVDALTPSTKKKGGFHNVSV